MILLALAFFIIAALYASVGFGGGSSYLALLVLSGVAYDIVPVLALLCNIVVVSGSSVHYIRAGLVQWKLVSILLVVSIPAAYVGGRTSIDKHTFISILSVALLVAGGRLLVSAQTYASNGKPPLPLQSYRYAHRIVLSMGLGGGIGFLAGLVGIGGGIFLAPILYSMRLAGAHQIAATAAVFILVNSLAGLVGQMQKIGSIGLFADYWVLPVMVLLGGQIGNMMALHILSPKVMAMITGGLVMVVGARLGLLALGIV